MRIIGKHARSGSEILSEKKKNVKSSFSVPERGTRETVMLVVYIVLLIALCLFFITPLRSCAVGRNERIGKDAAESVALEIAGITEEQVCGSSVDLVRIDGKYCYKVGLSDGRYAYSYILDASSGSLIASNVEENG